MSKLQDTLQTAFGRADDAFEQHVLTTLEKYMKDEDSEPVKKKLTWSMALACVLVITLGCAVAASLSPVADIFGWFYGEDYREGMLATGDSAPVGQSFTLGDVTYTLEEVVYYDNTDDPIAPALYGTGYIKAAEGSELVLIPEDYNVSDPAGYLVYYGKDEVIPADAKSYASLAEEKECKLVLAKLVPNGFLIDNELVSGDIGYSYMPQKDGSIQFMFEVFGGVMLDDNGAVIREQPLERKDSYTLSIDVSNWEVAMDGTWLRDEPKNTRIADEWVVTVASQAK